MEIWVTKALGKGAFRYLVLAKGCRVLGLTEWSKEA